MTEAAYLLPLGLIDGLNICVLSLVALLVSLMFTLNLTRRRVVLMGATFIAAVFVTYIAVGFGVVAVFTGFPVLPHILARVSAAIMIFIGLANIANYFSPNILPIYNVSTFLGRRAMGLMKTAAVPTLIGAGALTGLHSFPCACTGGIYPLFLSTLSISVQESLKPLFLFAYNALFIIPATAILLVCTNKHVTLRLRKVLHEKHDSTRLAMGVIMIIAAGIILWGALVVH